MVSVVLLVLLDELAQPDVVLAEPEVLLAQHLVLLADHLVVASQVPVDLVELVDVHVVVLVIVIVVFTVLPLPLASSGQFAVLVREDDVKVGTLFPSCAAVIQQDEGKKMKASTER